MELFPFTSVKVGGMDVGVLTSVQGNEGLALFSVLIFISVRVSRLGCYDTSCQSTNSLKDLEVHRWFYEGGSTRVSAGDAQAVAWPAADLSPMLRQRGGRKGSLQRAGVEREDTRGRRG